MGHPLLWVMVSGACASMWGVGYCFLAEVRTALKPATINTLYGAVLFLIGWLMTIYNHDVTNFHNLVMSARVVAYTLGYIVLFVVASNMQLWGYGLIDGNNGPYNAICSCYPLINVFVAYVFFGQKNINLLYVVPAMILIIGGVVLLAVAPPVATPSVPDSLNAPPTTQTHTGGDFDIPLSTP